MECEIARFFHLLAAARFDSAAYHLDDCSDNAATTVLYGEEKMCFMYSSRVILGSIVAD